ncbi:MAG TPA: hypothetical protein VM802_24225 [Chitinophaga sp.]|nr:hypothetical protein [Chitinophaga sp.]
MNIDIINPNAKFYRYQNDNKLRWLSNDDFVIWHSRTELKDEKYLLKPNWPECCPGHRSLPDNIVSYLSMFPHCCKSHKTLVDADWFTLEKLKRLPEKILETARQTENLIASKLDESDWYDHITEWIEYSIESFGQLPKGFGSPIALNVYLSHIEHILNCSYEKIYQPKIDKILAFINSYESHDGAADQVDIIELIGKYNKWLEIFPWQISYLTHLKAHFENQIPILSGEKKYNRYSGISKIRVITEERLVTFLMESTQHILKEVNAKALATQGNLSDPEKKCFEIINARRDHELMQLGENINDERKKLYKLFKQWFSGELRYLKEITPILEKLAEEPAIKSAGTERDRKDHYEIEKLHNEFCPRMPISEAVQHFKILTSTPSKNNAPFLTEEAFKSFIARAFGRMDIGKQKINFGRGETNLIISLFAEFFQKASRQWEPSGQCKDKYVSLLTDNFHDWKKSKVSANFKVRPGAWQ